MSQNDTALVAVIAVIAVILIVVAILLAKNQATPEPDTTPSPVPVISIK